MTICMENGLTYEKHIEDASGSVSSPLAMEHLTEKAFTCCKRYDKLWIESNIDAILNLDKSDSRP